MRVFRDFECKSCGTVVERYIPSDVRQIACNCGGLAQAVVSAPNVSLDGTDPSFPGAYEKWARVREQRQAVNKKKSYYDPS